MTPPPPEVPPLVKDREMIEYYLRANGFGEGHFPVVSVSAVPHRDAILVVLQDEEQAEVDGAHYFEWLHDAKVKHQEEKVP